MVCSTVYLYGNLPPQASQQMSSEARQQKAMYKLAMRLVQVARNSQLDDVSLRGYLRSLRDRYHQDCGISSGNKDYSKDSVNTGEE